uniref:Coenzyme Q-binding protein COQ10 START domain-containing protein n=1 Tax=Brassica campestris TaxID=3711 RepID=A0A3P5Y8Q8_BRACM|nr:unnamed protein product [Brassica rapa]
MSATAIFSLTNSNAVSTVFSNRKLHCNNGAVAKTTSRYSPSSLMKLSPLSSRFSPLLSPTAKSSVFRRLDTLMEWQECKVRKKVEVPVSVAYGLYSERESIPKWMTFISSVKVLKDKSDLSRWTLKYSAFGQNLEYSWLAKNLQASSFNTLCYTSPEPENTLDFSGRPSQQGYCSVFPARTFIM